LEGKIHKNQHAIKVPVHGPQEADFFCIICVFKNAYYNVGFDVFYLKKSFTKSHKTFLEGKIH
jgi:hypothetical protein